MASNADPDQLSSELKLQFAKAGHIQVQQDGLINGPFDMSILT